MTRSEMLIYFRELYELSSHTNDGKLDDEIDIYLNLAQDQIIEESLEEDEGTLMLRVIKNSAKAFNAVSSLLVTSSSLTLTADTEFANASKAAIPAGVRYIISAKCQVTRTNTNPTQSWYGGRPINPTDVYKYIYTGNNNPHIAIPLFTFMNGQLLFINDNSDVLNGAKVEYIKEPATIASGIDSELHISTHKDLVQKAVNIALRSSSIEPSDKVRVELQEDMQ